MNKKQTSKWIVDAALFAAFLLALFLDLTGLELHQWIGVAAGGLAVYHLLTHWTWVRTVTGRFFGRISARARLYYLLDAAILIGFFATGLTGLVISTWLQLSLTGYAGWLAMHIQASIITLVLTVAKIGLHWRWVVATARKIFSPPASPARRPAPGAVIAVAVARPEPALAALPATAAQAQQLSRHDFLKLMGIVGIASLCALGSAAGALREAGAGQDSADQAAGEAQDASDTQTRSGSTLASSGSDSSCSLQCGRRCAYPGNCRGYTDTNGSGRCDYGECA